MPAALRAVRAWLAAYGPGRSLTDLWDDVTAAGVPWARVASAAGFTVSAMATAFLMLMIGVFLAVEPGLYRGAVIRLLPPRLRPLGDDTLQKCVQALRQWLKGQAISMLFVGSATGLGLWLLDVPLALTLGLLAGF